MIEGITGKVGSGKSLLALTEMLGHFVRGGGAGSNIELNLDAVAAFCWKRGHRFRDRQFRFIDLRRDCLFHRQIDRGSGALNVKVYIDEAHLFFPAAEYRELRKQFLEVESFVSQSRKVGVDLYLITQAWENIWGQLRRQAQFIIECRDMRVIKFPLVGQALGQFLGLSWTRKDAQTDEALDTGRTQIARDVTSCYSTKQVYDDLMAELVDIMPEFHPVAEPVGWLRRTFTRPPARPVPCLESPSCSQSLLDSEFVDMPHSTE